MSISFCYRQSAKNRTAWIQLKKQIHCWHPYPACLIENKSRSNDSKLFDRSMQFSYNDASFVCHMDVLYHLYNQLIRSYHDVHDVKSRNVEMTTTVKANVRSSLLAPRLHDMFRNGCFLTKTPSQGKCHRSYNGASFVAPIKLREWQAANPRSPVSHGLLLVQVLLVKRVRVHYLGCTNTDVK